MSDTKWWLVCYDIHDEKRLRMCAKHMEGYGHRIQYSVFRCWMTSREVEQLRWELTKTLDPVDDVLVIPLCQRCVDGIVGIHGNDRPLEWPDRPLKHRIF